MSFQETTSVSWFGRIKRSAGGVLVGLLLVVGMVILLFWNEGRAVTTARSLDEGAGLVVSVDAGTVDPGREGMLVHLSGRLEADERISDPDFGIALSGVRLERTAEMFQWVESSRSETRKTLGGGEETVTTYSYARQWSASPHDSSRFRQPDGHTNPQKAVGNETIQLKAARLGAFDVDERALAQVGGAENLALTPELASAIRGNVQRMLGDDTQVTIRNGAIHLGDDPANPRVGDYRVTYRLTPLQEVSIVARQQGSALAPYQTAAGDSLLMVDSGKVPAEQMFAEAQSANTALTWALRIFGLLLLILGFSLATGPLGVIADIVPFLGGLVRIGTGLVAAVLGILVGTFTMALAWFYYRPLLALVIVGAGMAISFALLKMRKPKVETRPAAEAVPPAA